MKLPPAAKQALKRHVGRAVARIDPARYSQEPAYVAALFARLDDVVYRGREITIELKSTIVADRGPRSAESIWGADFALMASISGASGRIEKAVLGQAKRHSLVRIAPADAQQFRNQAVKMSAGTQAMVGLEVPVETGQEPRVRVLEMSPLFGETWAAQSALTRSYESRIFSNLTGEPPLLVGSALSLDQYLYAELLRCIHGDQRRDFIEGVSKSSLATLHIDVTDRV